MDAAFRAIEEAHRRVYGVPALPYLMTGGTDMSQVRAKGAQCYGIGVVIDAEDGPKGFGAHSDQERIREESLHQFVRVHYESVLGIAGKR